MTKQGYCRHPDVDYFPVTAPPHSVLFLNELIYLCLILFGWNSFETFLRYLSHTAGHVPIQHNAVFPAPVIICLDSIVLRCCYPFRIRQSVRSSLRNQALGFSSTRTITEQSDGYEAASAICFPLLLSVSGGRWCRGRRSDWILTRWRGNRIGFFCVWKINMEMPVYAALSLLITRTHFHWSEACWSRSMLFNTSVIICLVFVFFG